MPYRKVFELLEPVKLTQWQGFVISYWESAFIPERGADFLRADFNSNSGAQTFFN